MGSLRNLDLEQKLFGSKYSILRLLFSVTASAATAGLQACLQTLMSSNFAIFDNLH